MVKRIFLIVLLMVVLGPAVTSHAEFDPFPQNKGTIYEYDAENGLPEICFFGEGARWDGYEVMIGDWPKLTDYQKTMFIAEAAEEIEENEDVTVKIEDGWKILVAMNAAVSELHKSESALDMPMIQLLRDTLNEADLIVKKN